MCRGAGGCVAVVALPGQSAQGVLGGAGGPGGKGLLSVVCASSGAVVHMYCWCFVFGCMGFCWGGLRGRGIESCSLCWLQHRWAVQCWVLCAPFATSRLLRDLCTAFGASLARACGWCVQCRAVALRGARQGPAGCFHMRQHAMVRWR